MRRLGAAQAKFARLGLMTTYVALLRGIGPGNPNMHGSKLKKCFEDIGFTNVAPVISSGNVVFDSPSTSASALEKKIEQATRAKLGFDRAAIVRSQAELEKLVKRNPFKGIKDEKPNYLVVTFFKDRRKEVCTALDVSQGPTPDFMRDIEKKHGKALTTRTWKTMHRIVEKMNN